VQDKARRQNGMAQNVESMEVTMQKYLLFSAAVFSLTAFVSQAIAKPVPQDELSKALQVGYGEVRFQATSKDGDATIFYFLAKSTLYSARCLDVFEGGWACSILEVDLKSWIKFGK
jgi:hypothetical protein